MTDSERFELLWSNHHKQIDENRAVHRSLNELRNNIEEIKISIKDISDSDTELSKIIIKEIEKLTETVNNLKK
jgi:hypothetical protein